MERAEDVFDAVFAAQYPSLVRLAYLTTGSRSCAEDVVQDAFVEWYRRYDQVREPAAYLRRAVASRSTSWLRRRLLERRHRDPGWGEAVVPGLEADAAAVRGALTRLTPRQRAAVFLRYYLDLSEAEIAETLRCRPGTVKSILHRSLAALREQLDEC